jgi:hypothetical protein
MDELDELLRPKPLSAGPGIDAAVFAAMSKVQRRRRILRRGQRLALLTVCYAAGLASMWLWLRDRTPADTVVDQPPTQETPIARPSESPGTDPYRYDPPERLEKWAYLQTGDKRVELYRRAGDGYLRRDDVQAALRCYRRALDAGSAEDLAIRADKDSWLLMSLKVARQKERPDARVN